MFVLGKHKGSVKSGEIEREISLVLDKLPQKYLAVEFLNLISDEEKLRKPAQAACNYGLLMLSYLLAVKLMKDNGDRSSQEMLTFLVSAI
jgi:hypothetical protein